MRRSTSGQMFSIKRFRFGFIRDTSSREMPIHCLTITSLQPRGILTSSRIFFWIGTSFQCRCSRPTVPAQPCPCASARRRRTRSSARFSRLAFGFRKTSSGQPWLRTPAGLLVRISAGRWASTAVIDDYSYSGGAFEFSRRHVPPQTVSRAHHQTVLNRAAG